MRDYILKPFPATDSPFKVAVPIPAPAEAEPINKGQAICHVQLPASDRSGGVLREETGVTGAIGSGELPTQRAALTDAMMREAQLRANVCEDFLRLTRQENFTLVGAARALGKSPSHFSGPDSMLARYQRGGVAALLRPTEKSSTRNVGDVTKEIEALEWFIPAARYFYANTNLQHGRGSVPEAIRRTLSLPNLPLGWKTAMRARFLAAIGVQSAPVCPAELRELILAREKAGQPLVPERIARKITVNKSVIQLHRGPRDWELNNLSAPGSQRRYMNNAGARVIMQPGDWFGGDDATPGIAVCVPCNEVITPCSQKFKVLLGRFQWLAYHDCRTDKILAWDYVVRPRGGYRFEDILNGMGAVARTHGVPRKGWQFEGGTFNAKLVQEAIRLMGCEHWRTYSPHQKAIESVFNRVWTRLAVQFPHADMGRFRNENEDNCKLYEACKKGHQDPRRFFPTLEMVVQAFEEEVAAHNSRFITSEQYGRWIPDDYFAQEVGDSPLRHFNRDMDWIFSPFAAERKVRGMMVRCRVPMFEDFSVPFEFNADWMPMFQGRTVRMHFDPRLPDCTAKIVLLESFGEHKAGEILGDAQLIGETSGHIRFIMGYAADDQRSGYVARQRTNNFMRRVTRAVGIGGRVEYSKDEQRDGIATINTVEKNSSPVATELQKTGGSHPRQNQARVTAECPPAGDGLIPSTQDSRTARLREIEEFERNNQHLFT